MWKVFFRVKKFFVDIFEFLFQCGNFLSGLVGRLLRKDGFQRKKIARAKTQANVMWAG